MGRRHTDTQTKATTVKPDRIAVIAGLGNPGTEYEHTRHNVGFLAIDALAARHGARYWKSEAGCETTTIRVRTAAGETREVLLAKPQDFMNTCGGPISKLLRARHLAADQLLVVHDEVDLPEGDVRPKFGGGLNAHNGLRSIANKLGTRDFARLRCGIGRPPGKMDVATYVLRQLKGDKAQELELTAQDAADLVTRLLEGAA